MSNASPKWTLDTSVKQSPDESRFIGHSKEPVKVSGSLPYLENDSLYGGDLYFAQPPNWTAAYFNLSEIVY